MEWARFSKEAAFITRQAMVKYIYGVPIAVYRTVEGLKAYIAICPHKYHVICVRELVNGRYIMCQGHGELFKSTTGEPEGKFTRESLRPVELKVENGTVYVARPSDDVLKWAKRISGVDG